MAKVGTNAMGLDAEMYTRGKPGEADRRGESMVQKHKEKMQQDLEAGALAKISVLVPHLGRRAHLLALQETGWDVDRAALLLRSFIAAETDQLAVIAKKRKKLLTEAAGDGEGRPDRSASTSGSSSSSSSGSDSDSDGGRRRRKSKKGKRDQKSKHKRKSSSKHKKRRSRDRSRERERGGAKALAHSDDYGRYGIIREADYFNKRSEFAQWAADVKKVDIELLGKADERELFKEFIEDYNTGTLPHKKYYDLELYERQAAAKEAGRKEKRKPGAGLLSDEEALRAERAAAREREAKERLAQAYAELQATDKAKDMKEQELLRRQMQIAYKTGDMVKAQQLLARLAPEDDTKKK